MPHHKHFYLKGGNRSFAAFAKQGFVSPKAAIDASDYIYR